MPPQWMLVFTSLDSAERMHKNPYIFIFHKYTVVLVKKMLPLKIPF